MAILDAQDLLDQSLRLLALPTAGRPRQVNIRRAISSAYYSVFHAVLAAMADEFVGKPFRSTSRYAHVYRSVDHGRLRTVCVTARLARQKTPQGPLTSHAFGPDVQAFSNLVIDLQEARNRADYDPLTLVRTAEALRWISTASAAHRQFEQANSEDRQAFLTLLLCPGRRGA